VVYQTDVSAVLYNITQIPKTFNNLTLYNVIKVTSNFTATQISGVSVTTATFGAICYLNYSATTTPMQLTANTIKYDVRITPLYTLVVLNPVLNLT